MTFVGAAGAPTTTAGDLAEAGLVPIAWTLRYAGRTVILNPATVEIRENMAAELPHFSAIHEKYGLAELSDHEHLESLIADRRVLLAITPDGPPCTWTFWGFD